jgi:hypothetical protein
MDGTGVSPPDPPHRSLPLEVIGVSLAWLGRACAWGSAPMLCLARALRRIAPCGNGPGTACAARAVATNRTRFGGRLVVRFDGVSMLISLRGVAA